MRTKLLIFLFFMGFVGLSFGNESTKTAFIGGVEKHGTATAPVLVFLGDEIEYRIKAFVYYEDPPVMPSSMELRATTTDPTLIIEDKLPEGLELVTGSISDGGSLSGGIIKWELGWGDFTPGEYKTVTFKAKLKTALPPGGGPVIENTAKVTAEYTHYENMDGYFVDQRITKVSQTDTTYHKRAVCTVKFEVDPAAGGVLANGTDQVIDYNTNPGAGVTVTANPNYKFIKWKHGGFTSLKDGAVTPAADAPDDNANWYSTIDVKGDVTFTAEMELTGFAITYEYNDQAASPQGETMPTATPPTVANPTSYKPGTIPAVGITLNPPTRIGYTFKHWEIVSDEAGISVPNGANIPVGTSGNLTCTAQWEPKPFGIGYELNGGTAPAIANPTTYTIETLPETVGEAPTKAGSIFIGWQGVPSVGMSTNIVPTPAQTVTIPVKKDNVWTQDTLAFSAAWHQTIDTTMVSCEPPLKLKGLSGATSYKWESKDGKKLADTQAFEANKSGTYILATDYGTITTVDSFKVTFAFEGSVKLEHDKTVINKVGKIQKFYVKMDTTDRSVSYKWSFSEGDTIKTSSIKDSLYIRFNSPGEKEVSVEVTVTLPGGLLCTKVLSKKLKIYEKYHGFFVDQHVVGGRRDGSSWANAYKRIEQALDKARAGDCVWVARGTYTPPKGKSYEMMYDSVQVYGGFGAWENYLHERVFMSNPTIIRPSAGGDRVVHVAGGVSSAARWDGFIVEQGNATKGGGIYNEGSVTIANSIIRGNRADEGGGIYNDGGNPVIYNTEISGNTAKDGAAMYNNSSSPRLTNVTISGNLASDNGGGMYNNGSNPEIRNTIIWDNRASQHPNVSNASSTPNFTYSLIEKNRAGWDMTLGANGGGNVDGDPLFRKKGFDSNGNMQQGNYRFFAKSAAENQGYNGYVSSEETRDAHLPTLGEDVYSKGFPYDLSGLSRIIDDRVDIGAYEYAPDVAFPSLSRSIEIPQVEGLIIQPRPGIHYVLTGKDFMFTISEKKEEAILKAGEEKRLIERLGIKTGIPDQDKDGIKMTENEDGSVTVTLLKVSAPMKLTIDPYAGSTSAKTVSDDNVWSYDGNVMLSLSERSDVRIYDMKGRLMVHRMVDAGETAILLSEGFYVVRVGERNYKVIVK